MISKVKFLVILVENILFNKNNFEIKIIDFDLAEEITPLNRGNCTHPRGTVEYLSPELARREFPYSMEKNEVWQLGVLLFELFFQNVPFKSQIEIMTLSVESAIQQCQPRLITYDDVSLISSLLTKDPYFRPNLKLVKELLVNRKRTVI